jgi:general stress protein YciG
MAGNKIGGQKTREINYERHGKDFYKNIGSKGGKIAHKVDPETGKALKGFAVNRELARQAGKLGGSLSKRGKSSNE